MNTDRQLLQQALDALLSCTTEQAPNIGNSNIQVLVQSHSTIMVTDAIAALRARLAATGSLATFFMHDNHTVTSLRGCTPDALMAEADAIARTPSGSYGYLCPAKLRGGDLHPLQISAGVHAPGSDGPWVLWDEGLRRWRDEIAAHPGAMAALARRAELQNTAISSTGRTNSPGADGGQGLDS
jgi:hypothetical protein